MVWEINMGVCPRLEFDNSMFINCLGYDFYIYGAFEFFYAIILLIYDVMYDITTISYIRVTVIIISKVIDISCNGCRNVLLHTYIIDKFVDIGEFRPQTDQRSDDSNLQRVKGETGGNRFKAAS